MCGFLGGYFREKKGFSQLDHALKMIKHRGPDSQAFLEYKVNNNFLYLGHARLSIIDLSDSASQPFNSVCGRYSLIFNGEIYNYKELKLELKSLGHNFHTLSDTEVLLNALIEWGTDCLTRLIGMFSFVLYDHQMQKLTLARDAFGIKPFFYSITNDQFIFSSELRPLLHLRNKEIKPNLQRSYDYLVHGDYDSSTDSFVDGVKHLKPAHYLTYDLKTHFLEKLQCWWQPNIHKVSDISFSKAVSKLRELFIDSIKLHLRSDVPLGFALSGGIDSSAVVSVVRSLKPDLPLNTFSYIADNKNISEEKWIDQLNKKMKTISHKFKTNEKEMQLDLDEMLLKQGEPFGGTSTYAQYCVFKLAKESGVTVILDGQGADELLAGYLGYPGHRLLSIIETDGWIAAHHYARRWSQYRGHNYITAWLYLARIKLPDWLYKLFRKWMGRDFQPSWLDVKYLRDNGVIFNEKRQSIISQNKGLRVKEALANSIKNQGLPSLLRHNDRNSMSFSIESRVPFLTLPLANFLFSLPEHYLISAKSVTKHVFREAMRGIVPDTHLDRRDKIGFATPELNWMINMTDVIKKWIYEAPELPFLNKYKLLRELKMVSTGQRKFDARVWRWVNYLRWCTLMGIK